MTSTRFWSSRFSFTIGLLVIAVSLFLYCRLPAVAASPTWITVEGLAPLENVTKTQARQLAIDDARRKAVEQVVGVNVLSQTLVIDHRTAGDVVCTLPYGKVIHQEILKEEVQVTPAHAKGESPFLAYKVRLRVQVAKQSGRPDPYFQLDARLNRRIFKAGDDMQVEVTPTRDAYITIFNILEDENVLILFPNRFLTDNFVAANTTLVFPNEAARRSGIRLVATPADDRRQTRENMYILALKQPMAFDTAKYQEGIFGVYQGRSALACDLVRETVGIPLSQRAERFLPYRIVP